VEFLTGDDMLEGPAAAMIDVLRKVFQRLTGLTPGRLPRAPPAAHPAAGSGGQDIRREDHRNNRA